MTDHSPRDIGDLFAAIEAQPPATPGSIRRLLRPDLPSDIRLEVRFPERVRVLSVVTHQQVDQRDLLVTTGIRCTAGNGVVAVEAQPGVDESIFCTLVADLVQHLSQHRSAPGPALVQRVRTWQQALTRGLATGLSAEARLGLFGELLVLREIVLPASGALAVQAWQGPMRTPRDFLLADVGVEVKTVSHRDPDRCRISNENQLDRTGLAELLLVHQAVRSGATGVSLADLVDALRAEPALAEQQMLLEERLLCAGWLDLHRPQYAHEGYTLAMRRCYRIEDGFPRVTPADLPEGVQNVSYHVDLAGCAPYMIPERAVRDALVTAQNQGGRRV